MARLLAACAAILALAAPLLAGDPDMLQDICVAEYKSLQGPLRVNGYPCKRPENVTVDDFFFGGLAKAADVYGGGNPMGSVVTTADVEKVPGLSTLGVSMSRVDYAPWGGVNPPHAHPRVTEIIFVVDGALEVGFITTANRLITRAVPKGGVFVFGQPRRPCSEPWRWVSSPRRTGSSLALSQPRRPCSERCRRTCWHARCRPTPALWSASRPSSHRSRTLN
uniref:Uncharacterized protein n=1 Tax=Avena sativa TaxID=4498 RepID=A0ACD5XHZ7_AVESA